MSATLATMASGMVIFYFLHIIITITVPQMRATIVTSALRKVIFYLLILIIIEHIAEAIFHERDQSLCILKQRSQISQAGQDLTWTLSWKLRIHAAAERMNHLLLDAQLRMKSGKCTFLRKQSQNWLIHSAFLIFLVGTCKKRKLEHPSLQENPDPILKREDGLLRACGGIAMCRTPLLTHHPAPFTFVYRRVDRDAIFSKLRKIATIMKRSFRAHKQDSLHIHIRPTTNGITRTKRAPFSVFHTIILLSKIRGQESRAG
jgi:hypothetical protein